jgi:hypothetical protein
VVDAWAGHVYTKKEFSAVNKKLFNGSEGRGVGGGWNATCFEIVK